MLRQILVSDTCSEGAEAFLHMVQQVGAGENLTDAVQVFCQEIFYGQ